MVYINVVYDDEKSDYKNISHCAVRFGVRQWQDGKTELYFEFENGTDETLLVDKIRTINVCEMTQSEERAFWGVYG